MTARRSIVWIISLSFGLISSIAVIFLFDTTIEKFSIGNALLVFLSTAGLAFIWLDFILRTEYLKS